MKSNTRNWLAAALLLSPAAVAQVDRATATPASAAKPATKFASLVDTFEKANADYQTLRGIVYASEEFKKLRQARDRDGMTALLRWLKAPTTEFYPKFEALAEASLGSKTEIDCLLWMLDHNRDKKQNAATLATLAKRDLKSDFWAAKLRLIPFYMDHKASEALLTRLAKESPNLEIRLVARQVRTRAILRNPATSEDARAAAQTDLDALIVNHPNSIPALQHRARDFVKNRLQIGQQAPEITGVDLDGKAMKLSNYLGRVTVLDFWGDW